MSKGKCPSVEHLCYGGVGKSQPLIFNLCAAHTYLPRELIETIVVPILKNKTGDASDRDNYRPISLAPVIAKVMSFIANAVLGRITFEKHVNLQEA